MVCKIFQPIFKCCLNLFGGCGTLAQRGRYVMLRITFLLLLTQKSHFSWIWVLRCVLGVTVGVWNGHSPKL